MFRLLGSFIILIINPALAFSIEKPNDFVAFGISANMTAEQAFNHFISKGYRTVTWSKSGVDSRDVRSSIQVGIRNGRTIRPRQGRKWEDPALIQNQSITANIRVGKKRSSCTLVYTGDLLQRLACNRTDRQFTAFPVIAKISERFGQPNDTQERGTTATAIWNCTDKAPESFCTINVRAASGSYSLTFTRNIDVERQRLQVAHQELQKRAAREKRGNLKLDF